MGLDLRDGEDSRNGTEFAVVNLAVVVNLVVNYFMSKKVEKVAKKQVRALVFDLKCPKAQHWVSYIRQGNRRGKQHENQGLQMQ